MLHREPAGPTAASSPATPRSLPVPPTVADPRSLAELVLHVFALLDDMAHDSTADRLAAVADAVAAASGASGWSIFGDEIVEAGMPRMLPRRQQRPAALLEQRFPAALDHVVDVAGLHATDADGPAELRERVAAARATEILAIGGYAPDAARWVVEFYADEQTLRLADFLAATYAAVQAGLGYPRPGRGRGRHDGPGPRLREVGRLAQNLGFELHRYDGCRSTSAAAW